ncbi:MAG: DUF58 domain-containing protein [Pseudomonadota bacterium]
MAEKKRHKKPAIPKGLFSGRTGLKREAEEAVESFPGLLLEAEHAARTITSGAHGRRRAGPGDSFWQHRPYAFGDPVSAIDWRQSARASDRLYIRQNEWSAAASAWFWRDPSRSLDYRSLDYRSNKEYPTKRWRADVLAVALSMLLVKAGERIGLIGGREEPYHGRLAPQLLLDALKPEEFSDDDKGAANTPPPVRIRDGAAVILLSDFYCDLDALKKSAAGYAAQGAKGLFIQIVDPAEIDFPFTGRTEFEDLETPDRLLFGNAASVRDQYLNAFTALQDDLKSIARALGWTHILHRTDASASAGLAQALSALNGEPPIEKTPAIQKTPLIQKTKHRSDGANVENANK